MKNQKRTHHTPRTKTSLNNLLCALLFCIAFIAPVSATFSEISYPTTPQTTWHNNSTLQHFGNFDDIVENSELGTFYRNEKQLEDQQAHEETLTSQPWQQPQNGPKGLDELGTTFTTWLKDELQTEFDIAHEIQQQELLNQQRQRKAQQAREQRLMRELMLALASRLQLKEEEEKQLKVQQARERQLMGQLKQVLQRNNWMSTNADRIALNKQLSEHWRLLYALLNQESIKRAQQCVNNANQDINQFNQDYHEVLKDANKENAQAWKVQDAKRKLQFKRWEERLKQCKETLFSKFNTFKFEDLQVAIYQSEKQSSKLASMHKMLSEMFEKNTPAELKDFLEAVKLLKEVNDIVNQMYACEDDITKMLDQRKRTIDQISEEASVQSSLPIPKPEPQEQNMKAPLPQVNVRMVPKAAPKKPAQPSLPAPKPEQRMDVQDTALPTDRLTEDHNMSATNRATLQRIILTLTMIIVWMLMNHRPT